jgi:hypothetical protein
MAHPSEFTTKNHHPICPLNVQISKRVAAGSGEYDNEFQV